MSPTFSRDRQWLDPGFSWVPRGMWTLPVSFAARVLLGWLHSHSDEELASLDLTSVDSGALHELMTEGFIRRDGASLILVQSAWEELA